MKRHPENLLLTAIRGTRRQLLAGTGAAALALPIGNAASAQESGTPESPQTSPTPGWSFTDDKGNTITLPEAPTRVVADVNAAAPLWDMGIRPVAVFGWNATDTGDFGAAGGRIDPEAVDIVGTVAEPINVEKLVAVQPDLIVTLTFTTDDPDEYWSIDPELVDQVRSVAPIVGISTVNRADHVLERYTELATLLVPATADNPATADEKAAYEKATATLRQLAAAKPEMSFLFVAASPDSLYVAAPPTWGDLLLFEHLGVNLVAVENPTSPYWDTLSWEQALKYPSDVVMNSWRGDIPAEELKDQPTFGLHPAIASGQIGYWYQDLIPSYIGLTESLQSVIDILETAQDVDGEG